MKKLLIKAKKIFIIFLIAFMLVSYTSCETYTYATTQDDIYVEQAAYEVRTDIDFSIVIRYGTPYYYNGTILYYLYNDLYYYPFYYDNYWYMRVYSRPFRHIDRRPYFRPNRYDRKFDYRPPRPYYDMNHRPHQRPHYNNGHMNRPPHNRPNNGNINRPPQTRPDRMPRNSQNNRRLGGKR